MSHRSANLCLFAPCRKSQNAVTHGEYDVTIHAVEEMAEDGLDIFDVESAIMNGQLTKTEIDGPRGERYTVRLERQWISECMSASSVV